MKQHRVRLVVALAALGACFVSWRTEARAQGVPANLIAPSWVEPFKPFRVIGNVHCVGTRGLAMFLITSPEGHILIDTGLEQSAPFVLANVERLGFNVKDIKIILSSHAHFDHVAGHALIQKATGASVFASEADATLLETGGKADFRFGNDISFTPVTVDRRLKDGDKVTLGAFTLTARLTPGHTKGNTTWLMTVRDQGRDYQVVLAGSMTINPGVKMLNYTPYPASGADYARSLDLLESLHPDIYFAPHGGQFKLEEKVKAFEQNPAVNPFVDPEGYRAMVASWKKVYLAQVESEKPKP